MQLRNYKKIIMKIKQFYQVNSLKTNKTKANNNLKIQLKTIDLKVTNKSLIKIKKYNYMNILIFSQIY